MVAVDGQGAGRMGIPQGLQSVGSSSKRNSSLKVGGDLCNCSRHSSYGLGEIVCYCRLVA